MKHKVVKHVYPHKYSSLHRRYLWYSMKVIQGTEVSDGCNLAMPTTNSIARVNMSAHECQRRCSSRPSTAVLHKWPHIHAATTALASRHRHLVVAATRWCQGQPGLAAWCSGNGVGRISEVTLRRARLVLAWVTCLGSTPGGGTLFRYVTSHPGRLSLSSFRGR